MKCNKCLNYAEWKGGVLQCSKCGQMIALRYKIGEDVHIYTFQKFKWHKREIEKRKDSYEITEERDLLGNVSYSEFGDLQRYVRPDETELLPLQEDEGGICETCKSEDSNGIQENDNLEAITY